MIPIFPSVQKLSEEKNLSIKNFDAVFNDIISATNDGYFTIADKEGAAYLFVVGGRPYASGRTEKDGLSFLDVQDFFDAYSTLSTASVVFHKVEKKLLLSILVYFKKRPAHKFTADMVDMEKVLNDLAHKGTDSIIATRCGEKTGFCICLKGRPSFNYLPDGAHSQEQPRDGLLLYIFGQKDCVPSIEVFDDIQMTPAPDAISPKGELPKSLTAHYIKKSSASVSVKGAEVILLHEDNIIHKYEIMKAETAIGRAAGSDILIENPGVSRHHAVIKEKAGKFLIEDKGSANGTFINGEKITTKELKDGDLIQILNYTLMLKYPQTAGAEQTILLTQPVAEPPAKPPVRAPVPPPVSPEVKTKPGGQSKLVLEDGKEHILKSTVTTIGSNEDMELNIEGKGVEAHQASILRGKGGEFILVHKGGKTPTKVNGGKTQEHHLKNGDVIEIGQYKIKYVAS